MGLNASVRCRCWEDGKTSRCPLPDRVRVSTEDDCLEIDLPWKGNEQVHETFDAWVDNGCGHPRMRFVDGVHIGNWGSFRRFQAALRSFCGERFGHLLACLPDSNGGLTLPTDAKICLAQLEDFAAQADFGQQVQLIDVETGRCIFTYFESYRGVVILTGDGIDCGVDPEGFFVRRRGEHKSDLFRSKNFEQIRHGANEFELFSLDPVARYSLKSGIGNDNVYPKRLAVVAQRDHPREYSYAVNALLTVFTASIETGNPVSWS
jgi:hypothetical protein